MTDKQLYILKKYFSSKALERIKKMEYTDVSDLIGLIISTRGFDFKRHCEKPSKEQSRKLEELINSNITQYSRIHDEYCSMTDAYKIFGTSKTIYRMEQKWFKGESSSPDYNWFFINEDGEKFSGVYETLLNEGITSISQLLESVAR